MDTSVLQRETTLDQRHRPERSFIHILAQNPVTLLGFALIILVFVVAVAAPVLARQDPVTQDVSNRLQAPSAAHLLGTDEFGRDVLSRVIYGSRISLEVGGLSTILAFVVGTIVGLIAGYRLGWLDSVLMRLMDAMMTVPGILLAIGILAALGPGAKSITLALAIVYAPRLARVVRSTAIGLREREFIEASRSSGATDMYIVLRHILPNALGPTIVQATITFAYAVLAEASLSFLGLGTPPPAPSWGNILNDGRGFLYNAPWVAIFPGIAISITVLGINLLGDGLRDLLDPRLR